MRLLLALLPLLILFAACDAVEPTGSEQIVVEAFFDTGEPLPDVVVRRTLPLDSPYNGLSAVTDATVNLVVDGGTSIPYHLVNASEGRYAPLASSLTAISEGTRFRVDVFWGDQHAAGEAVAPPEILVDSVRIHVPDEPVSAILLDSLVLDSLQSYARSGWIYPVEVSVFWSNKLDETGADSAYWVRTNLKPQNTFSSTFINFFLRRGQILRERSLPRDENGARVWSGVYAVPVDKKADPMPSHQLRVALLRSDFDYARFASSRDAPERREPVTNVKDGLGIIAGVSVDSLTFQIAPGHHVYSRP